MNCAQVKEQLVDFLYDELPPPLRAAFAEHLRGCPGCNAEVASHQRSLGQARAALTGPLLQEAPARLHLAVMEAAKAQARSAHKAATSHEPGFFARLWRTPWLLPAFGAASIATAVFLVRVLKSPEVLPGQKPQPMDELTLAPPQAATPPAAVPGAEMPAEAEKRAEQKPTAVEPAPTRTCSPSSPSLRANSAAARPTASARKSARNWSMCRPSWSFR